MDRIIGIALVLLAMLCEAFGNIAFKRAADSGHDQSKIMESLHTALRQYRMIAAGLLCFIAEAIIWTISLRYLDVSQAYPISSVELVIILLLSKIILKEQVGLRRWAGVALIVGGTILVGAS